MKYVSSQFVLAATDLSNHLACAHLTQLHRQVALGEIKKATWYDPSLEILIQRGREHEAAYIAHLAAKGLSVENAAGKGQQAVLDAMQRGVDVIVQGELQQGVWMGYADILMKVAGSSRFGAWMYEVQDTKLAQNTRAATILQLCLYTDLLATLQQSTPEYMHVVKPGENFPVESYRFAEFSAYYRLARKNFEEVINGPAQSTYPEPVAHCNICQWWQVCDRKRHADDHLSLVAGIRALHISELRRQHINTLEAFARVEKLDKPQKGNRDTFIRKQRQAQIQLEGRLQNKLLHRLLPLEPGRGLYRLPVPDAGDIYFDIEGDMFYEGGGLEYLLGYAHRHDGAAQYTAYWSSNRVQERRAFMGFMQFVMARWERFPNLHIYHFAPYEPAAIKRLARVHAVFEKEVDDLLRAGRFIDLHAVFKEALLAGVEVYSLKELEKFTRYTRTVDLHDASAARKSVEIALESNAFARLAPVTVDTVAQYNHDDCLATEALHQWLEQLRRNVEAGGEKIARPELRTGEASENVQALDTRAQAIYRSLIQNLPEDRATWTAEQQARWLLAHQIEYFRREDKSVWWEFYRVHELDHDDLLDERKAITGLRFVETLPKEGRERNITQRYSYPPQDTSIDEGDEVIAVKGEKIGTVRAIAPDRYTIDIKKTANAVDIHPAAIHVSERVDPGTLATALMDIAAVIDEDGLGRQWPFYASKDLLMRRKPRFTNGEEGAYMREGETPVDAAVRMALHLDKSVLAIQGPPGAGKTYTGASMIAALVQAGKKIGITAVSHKVIRHLAEATITRAGDLGIPVSFVHKITDKSESPPERIAEVDKSDKARAALAEGKVVCGTAWLWAEDASREVLDYLFVDEAGQMSLSQVLAASRAAKNLILLGDPQQLEQPQRGAHPEGSDVAGLTYLLNGAPTMPEGMGLFLDTTRRMHPALCRFTSEVFYEGKLNSLPGLEKQFVTGGTPFDGAGLFYVPVPHAGNQSCAPEEVSAIKKMIHQLLAQGRWTNAQGETHPLHSRDILVVAPYNAQVAALMEALPGMRIGTVDKFQGQEAPVVIYSMAASSVEDAPKGMAFLFNPNRLNVATSRAKSVTILVAAPKLLEAECRTIDHMRWANTMCRFRELARN